MALGPAILCSPKGPDKGGTLGILSAYLDGLGESCGDLKGRRRPSGSGREFHPRVESCQSRSGSKGALGPVAGGVSPGQFVATDLGIAGNG